MIVSKRKKEAQRLCRPDLIPKELTRLQTLEAFDFEIELRMECIKVLEDTAQEDLK